MHGGLHHTETAPVRQIIVELGLCLFRAYRGDSCASAGLAIRDRSSGAYSLHDRAVTKNGLGHMAVHGIAILWEIGFDDRTIAQREADAVLRATMAAESASDTTMLGSYPGMAS